MESVFGPDGVRIDESRRATTIEDDNADLAQLRQHGRGLADTRDHFANPRQEPTVIERGLTDIDTEGGQLPGLAQQPGRVCQHPDGHRPIGRGHAAHCLAGDQGGSGAQPR
jgi:hypothetical protein